MSNTEILNATRAELEEDVRRSEAQLATEENEKLRAMYRSHIANTREKISLLAYKEDRAVKQAAYEAEGLNPQEARRRAERINPDVPNNDSTEARLAYQASRGDEDAAALLANKQRLAARGDFATRQIPSYTGATTGKAAGTYRSPLTGREVVVKIGGATTLPPGQAATYTEAQAYDLWSRDYTVYDPFVPEPYKGKEQPTQEESRIAEVPQASKNQYPMASATVPVLITPARPADNFQGTGQPAGTGTTIQVPRYFASPEELSSDLTVTEIKRQSFSADPRDLVGYGRIMGWKAEAKLKEGDLLGAIGSGYMSQAYKFAGLTKKGVQAVAAHPVEAGLGFAGIIVTGGAGAVLGPAVFGVSAGVGEAAAVGGTLLAMDVVNVRQGGESQIVYAATDPVGFIAESSPYLVAGGLIGIGRGELARRKAGSLTTEYGGKVATGEVAQQIESKLPSAELRVKPLESVETASFTEIDPMGVTRKAGSSGPKFGEDTFVTAKDLERAPTAYIAETKVTAKQTVIPEGPTPEVIKVIETKPVTKKATTTSTERFQEYFLDKEGRITVYDSLKPFPAVPEGAGGVYYQFADQVTGKPTGKAGDILLGINEISPRTGVNAVLKHELIHADLDLKGSPLARWSVLKNMNENVAYSGMYDPFYKFTIQKTTYKPTGVVSEQASSTPAPITAAEADFTRYNQLTAQQVEFMAQEVASSDMSLKTGYRPPVTTVSELRTVTTFRGTESPAAWELVVNPAEAAKAGRGAAAGEPPLQFGRTGIEKKGGMVGYEAKLDYWESFSMTDKKGNVIQGYESPYTGAIDIITEKSPYVIVEVKATPKTTVTPKTPPVDTPAPVGEVEVFAKIDQGDGTVKLQKLKLKEETATKQETTTIAEQKQASVLKQETVTPKQAQQVKPDSRFKLFERQQGGMRAEVYFKGLSRVGGFAAMKPLSLSITSSAVSARAAAGVTAAVSPSVVVTPVSDSMVAQMPAQAQEAAVAQDAAQASAQSLITSQQTDQASRSRSRTRPRPDEPIRITPVPTIPSSRGQRMKENLFGVEVRRRGKFQTVGKGLPFEEAVKKGAGIVSATAAASFRIEAEDAPSKQSPFDFINRNQFRRSKREAGVIVEKSRFRISTPGEVGEISRKGQAASKWRGKKKRLFGGISGWGF